MKQEKLRQLQERALRWARRRYPAASEHASEILAAAYAAGYRARRSEEARIIAALRPVAKEKT